MRLAGELPQPVDSAASAAESFTAPFRRGVNSIPAAIPKTVEYRLGGLRYLDLDPLDEMTLHASLLGMTAKPHESDRREFDAGHPSGAVNGHPDSRGRLQRHFVKLELG